MTTYEGMSTHDGIIVVEDIRIDMAVRLVEERARAGYSQAGLARLIGVSREGLRLYEMGQREIRSEFLHNIAKIGFDVHYILTGERLNDLHLASKQKDYSSNKQVKMSGNSSANIVDTVHGGANVNFGDTINTQKHVTKTIAEVRPGSEHITEEQAARIQKLVAQIAELEGRYRKSPASFRSIWSSLNYHLGVTKYRLIPLHSFEKAEIFLRSWIGRLSSQKKASSDDEVRKRRYAYIHINTKDDERWLNNYLTNRFSTISLTSLDDKQLEQAYRAVAGRKSGKKRKKLPKS